MGEGAEGHLGGIDAFLADFIPMTMSAMTSR
jgi:hypothetical protein